MGENRGTSRFDYAAVGERIKICRKEKGLTQVEFADRLGKALRTVQKYEMGEIEISLSVLNEIAELFGIGIDELLNLGMVQTFKQAVTALYQAAEREGYIVEVVIKSNK